jgi:methionyl-tRNA formyltransferase
VLRILFVTQDDPFYVCEFFREFGSIYDRNQLDVAGVMLQAPLGKKYRRTLVRQMLQFYGMRDFLRLGSRYVAKRFMGILAADVFRGKFPGSFSLRHVLLRNGWTILPWSDVNADAVVSWIAGSDIDIVVSVAASQKFGDSVLSASRYGCINVHNALLPRNRGMLPNFWSLYNCDRHPVSGMTVHKMNSRLDDGPIIIQKEVVLDRSESLHHLMLRTKRMNARLVLDALALYRNGEPALMPNDASLSTYHTFPTKEDVKAFRAKGLKLL